MASEKVGVRMIQFARIQTWSTRWSAIGRAVKTPAETVGLV